MNGTALAFIVFGSLFVASLVCHALALYLGARWAKAPAATPVRAALAAVLLIVVVWFIGALVKSIQPIPFLNLLAQLAVSVAIISLCFKATAVRAAQIWIATLPVSLLGSLVILFVVRLYLFEAFVISSIGMSPTLLGPHQTGTCPDCGAAAYGRQADSWQSEDSNIAMCSAEMKSVRVTQFTTASTPDRVMTAKMFQPRRWDLLVFRYPARPEQVFVKRVVGMPGETIRLADGAAWINGERLTPPAELKGLEFRADLMMGLVHGTNSNPATLRDDEYFVLGDFHVNSLDSRYWHTGAPGRPPYAVPADHVVGVVAAIYWPPSRWRSFR